MLRWEESYSYCMSTVAVLGISELLVGAAKFTRYVLKMPSSFIYAYSHVTSRYHFDSLSSVSFWGVGSRTMMASFPIYPTRAVVI